LGWTQRLAAAAALFAGGLGLALSGSASASAPHRMAVPVDRQDYVTSLSTTNPTDGSLIDPYDGDPSSIHVAVNGGAEFARSFVHVALDYLPPHSAAKQLTVTLHVPQKADASNKGTYPIYNVNTSSAIVEACALTTELPANFDYTKPPDYDCAHGSVSAYRTRPATRSRSGWRSSSITGACTATPARRSSRSPRRQQHVVGCVLQEPVVRSRRLREHSEAVCRRPGHAAARVAFAVVRTRRRRRTRCHPAPTAPAAVGAPPSAPSRIGPAGAERCSNGCGTGRHDPGRCHTDAAGQGLG